MSTYEHILLLHSTRHALAKQTVGNDTTTGHLHAGQNMCRSIILFSFSFSRMMRLAGGFLFALSASFVVAVVVSTVVDAVNDDAAVNPDGGVVNSSRAVNTPLVRDVLPPADAALQSVLVASLLASLELLGFHLGFMPDMLL